jgi:hypothetical protein
VYRDPILFLVLLLIGGGFVLIAGTILYRMFKGVRRWAENKSRPVESLPARVVTKRTEVSGAAGAGGYGGAATYYYCTFELADGERLELQVKGPEYGLLVEGDEGTLTHQGTRYHGFRRRIS